MLSRTFAADPSALPQDDRAPRLRRSNASCASWLGLLGISETRSTYDKSTEPQWSEAPSVHESREPRSPKVIGGARDCDILSVRIVDASTRTRSHAGGHADAIISTSVLKPSVGTREGLRTRFGKSRPSQVQQPKTTAPGARGGPVTKRMRILITNSTLHIGGAEQVAADLARCLDRKRFVVTACYLKENGTIGEQMQRNGVDLVPIPGLKGGRDYFTSLKLLKHIKQRRIDLLHTHDLHSFIDGSICKFLRPSLRHVHTFHWGKYPQIEPQYGRIERALWRIPDMLVAVGHEQAEGIRQLYGIPQERLRVLWNGVDAPRSELAPEIAARLGPTGDPVIGSISTLIPQKGLFDLLDAAAIVHRSGRRFKLMLAGEGVLRSQLETRAAELGLTDVVIFLGWVQQASQRALPACDIFVQSSHWEAMSIVLLEAMAAHKPIVATSVGENGRILVDGESGLLVPPRQPQALAAALIQALG